jgi:hypothetical protein
VPLRHLRVTDAQPRADQRRHGRRQAADEDDQVGTGARLGKRGGELAAVLQGAQALHQRIAAGRIPDRAGGAGQRVQRAGAGDIAAQAGEQRLPACREHRGGGGERGIEGGRPSVDLGRGRARLAGELAEGLAGALAVAALQRQRLVAAARAHTEVVARQGAERAGPDASGRGRSGHG